MPIHGLVIRLSDLEEAGREALARLKQVPGLELGEAGDRGIPVVLETGSMEEAEAFWELLGGLDGVVWWELALADFSDVEEVNRDLLRRRGCRRPEVVADHRR